VATIVDLVRYHLLLPSVATGRDLGDPATIEMVATAVGSEEVLDLLHAITEADSLATGHTAWSSWKAQLVEQLVEATRATLRSQHPAVVPSALDESLRAEVELFDGALRVAPRPGGVTIVAPDALGLLAVEVAVLGVHAQNVHSARTATVGTVAVGEFELEPERGREPDWDQFAEDLRGALRDPEPVRERLHARARRYRQFSRPTAARPAEPRVIVDNELTEAATIVEVRAADGIGVLYRITNAFAQLGLTVVQAYVSTRGHDVTDTFYVTDADGAKLADPAQLGALGRFVLLALESSDFIQSDDQVR